MSLGEIILHVGTHKTGSTALQRALRASSAELATDGIAFLSDLSERRLLMPLTEKDDRIIAGYRKDLRRAVRRGKKKGAVRFVLSDEGWSGDPWNGYANTAVVADSLREICDGFDVRVVVYLRRQDDFLESMYTQTIHVGAAWSFDEYLAQIDGTPFDWQRLVRIYSERFGQAGVIVRRYNRLYLPDLRSILTDFAEVIGASSLQVSEEGPVNAGYSRDALEIARRANGRLSFEEQKRLRAILQRAGSKQPFERYAFFGDDERASFLERYAASNAAVARQYFGGASGELFPPPAERPAYEGLAADAVAAILAQALVAPSPSLTIRALEQIEAQLLRWLSRSPRLWSVLRAIARRAGLLRSSR